MNITKERIDEVVLTATQNNLFDLMDKIADAMNLIPEEKQNPIAYTVAAASVVQGTVMAALKDVLYELLTEEK